MKRRGRPPHPNVLTPREWEVLGLVREGMTNEQIAERLQISVRGVKFHVSEIIGKLGVSDRRGAARWSGGGHSSPVGAIALPLRRASWPMLPGAISSGAMIITVAAVALLAWGVFATRERSTDNSGPDTTAPAETAISTPVGFDVVARPAREYDILYYYEPVSTFGRLYMQRVDAASHATTERETQISDVTGVTVASTNSAAFVTWPRYLTTEATDPSNALPPKAHVTVRGFDGEPPADTGDAGASELSPIAVTGGDVLYRAQSKTIVAYDASGSRITRYPMPEAKQPIDSDFLQDGKPMKGAFSDESFVRELLSTPSGDVWPSYRTSETARSSI